MERKETSRAMAVIGYSREARKPRIKRMSSASKARRLKVVLERDGPGCNSCGMPEVISANRAIVGGPRNKPNEWVWGYYYTSNIDLDHIMPLWMEPHVDKSWRELNDPENLQLLCKSCHRKKSGKENGLMRKLRGGKL